MAAEIQKYIRLVKDNGDVVLTNLVDSNTGEYVTYNKVTEYADGTPMDDSKCDGVIYRKLGDEYFVDTEYSQTQTVSIDRLGIIYNNPNFDNMPIIQNFIDRLKNDIPIKLYFPKGGIIYLTQIRLRSNITLEGDMAGRCIIRRIPTYSTDNYVDGKPDMGLIQAYKLDKTGGYWKNIVIRNIELDGNWDNLTITVPSKIRTVKSHNIDLRLCDGVLIENCIIRNSVWSGIGLTGCQNVVIRNNDVIRCGIKTWDSEPISRNGISLNAVWWNPVTNSFVFEESKNYEVINNRVDEAHQEGIQFISIVNIKIIGNVITNCLDRAIEGDNAFQGGGECNTVIKDNFCKDNRWAGMSFRNRPEKHQLIISNNTIMNASRYAISVVSDNVTDEVNDVVISGNIIENIGYENPGNTGQNIIYIQANAAIVSGNIMKELYQRAISFQQCVDVNVSDNIIEAVQPYTNISGVGFSPVPSSQVDVNVKSINVHNNLIANYSLGLAMITSIPVESLKINNNTFRRSFRYITLSAAIAKAQINHNTFKDETTNTVSPIIVSATYTIDTLEACGNMYDRTSRLIDGRDQITTLTLLNNSDNYNRFKGQTEAPTVAGTAGDIIWKINPAKGQPVGWIFAQGNQTTNIQGWLAIAYPEFNGLKRALSNSRPILSQTDEGHQFYDRSLQRWIYWTGTSWIEDIPIVVLNYNTNDSAADRTITEAKYGEKKEVLVEATSITNPCIVYLSLASMVGRKVTLKKVDSSAIRVTLRPRSETTDTIEGLTEVFLEEQNESVTVVSDGTEWKIVARYRPSLYV